MSSMPSTPSPYYDEDGRTDAEIYLTDIYDGKIVAGRWMRKLSEMMLPRFHGEYHGYHYSPSRGIRVVTFLERFCVIPEGDKMWQPFILEQFQRACIELAYGFVDENDIRQFQQVVFELGRKNGKGVCVNTELPTPSGWTKMGDIHVGDVVFGQDGKPSTVIGESEIFDKPTYAVTFEDGSKLTTSDDHIWTVQTKNSRKSASYVPKSGKKLSPTKKYHDGGWFETTTQEMFDDPKFVHHRPDGKGVEYKYRVPMAAPAEYPEKFLPIDPYTFGYWIGDGTSSGATLTISEGDLDEAISIIESCGHTCSVRRHDKRAPTVLLDANTCLGTKSNAFKATLGELGVLNNKHIPDIYLQASTEQRWELLRGLMDTDGYCSKAGQCEFSQKHEHIADQFIELCSSLGIKATKYCKEARCNGKPCGMVYRVQFWTDKEHSCFHLKRKHDRLKDKLAPRMSCKTIVSIERIPNEPTKCIVIDNPSHLYLVGRHYTATHNSSLIAGLGVYHLTSDGEPGAEVYCCATSEPQAKKVMGAADSMIFNSRFLKDKIRRGTSQKTGKSALNYDKNGSMMCTLAANPKKRDGASASALIYDELAAAEDNGALLDNLEESMSARRQPMTWILSSENYIRDGIWDERLEYCHGILDGSISDDTVLPLLYTQDDRREIFDGYEDPTHRVWLKANPGLFTIKDADRLAHRVNQAMQSPRRLPAVITKEFCLRSGSYSAFLDAGVCVNNTPIDFNVIGIPLYVCVGLDLATRNDLCACVCRWRVPGDDRIYELAKFWIASDMLNMQTDANQKDNVPYLFWSTQGQEMDGTIWNWVDIVEGDRVNQSCIIDFLQDLVSVGMYPYCIAYDSWHVDDYTDRTIRRLVGDSRCYPVPQTARVLSPLLRTHELDLKARKVICPNPCLHHSRQSLECREDNGGNLFPRKKDLRRDQKIDGVMAELFCLAAEQRYYEEYMAAIGWTEP